MFSKPLLSSYQTDLKCSNAWTVQLQHSNNFKYSTVLWLYFCTGLASTPQGGESSSAALVRFSWQLGELVYKEGKNGLANEFPQGKLFIEVKTKVSSLLKLSVEKHFGLFPKISHFRSNWCEDKHSGFILNRKLKHFYQNKIFQKMAFALFSMPKPSWLKTLLIFKETIIIINNNNDKFQ